MGLNWRVGIGIGRGTRDDLRLGTVVAVKKRDEI